MIIKFKIFENNREPQVGDYILVDYNEDNLVDYNKNDTIMQKIVYFMNNNIGRIIKNHGNYFSIEYENVPIGLKLSVAYIQDTGRRNGRYIPKRDIKYFSPNKEEVEIEMNADMYNI